MRPSDRPSKETYNLITCFATAIANLLNAIHLTDAENVSENSGNARNETTRAGRVAAGQRVLTPDAEKICLLPSIGVDQFHRFAPETCAAKPIPRHGTEMPTHGHSNLLGYSDPRMSNISR